MPEAPVCTTPMVTCFLLSVNLMTDTLMSAEAAEPISAATAAVYDDTAVVPEHAGHWGAHLLGELGVRGD